MSQLLLDIAPKPAPTFENFVVGRNREAVASLTAALQGQGPERFFYIWGDCAAGKSHLLRSAAHRVGTRGRYLACTPEFENFPLPQSDNVYAVDAVDNLGDAGQIALFHFFNELRASAGVLIACGRNSPQMSALRPELASRLAWGLVFRLHSLSDDEKLEAIARQASARGFDLPLEVSRYLLVHCERDLSSLLEIVSRLDEYSLRLQRPVTLPLLKQILEKPQPWG